MGQGKEPIAQQGINFGYVGGVGQAESGSAHQSKSHFVDGADSERGRRG